jgi:Na+-transporting methylmalonyl-CoA/oxaloacetate decarboxylase gamma subunit
MTDWLVFLFAALLIFVVLAALAFIFLQEETPRETRSEEFHPHRVEERVPPVIKSAPAQWELGQTESQQTTEPRTVFRKRERPAHAFHVKRTTGIEPAPTNKAAPHAKTAPPPAQNSNGRGGPVSDKRLRVNLDAICRVTGKTIRTCKCPNCQEERANFGS